MQITFLKSILILCLVLALFKTGRAQPGGGADGNPPPLEFTQNKTETPDEIARRETKWMKKKLRLIPEQLAPVEDINFEHALKKQDIIDNLIKKGIRPTREQLLFSEKAFDTLAEDKDSKLSKVLTSKQWGIYLSKKKQLENNGQNMPFATPPGRVGSGFSPP